MLVSVVVLTRDRFTLFLRAIQSIADQRSAAIDIEVIIGTDHCEYATNVVCLVQETFSLRCQSFDFSNISNADTSERLAIARNTATSLSSGQFLCHLDDDNFFYDKHISSLVELSLTKQVPAVHSWRHIFDQKGKPYPLHASPWDFNDGDGINFKRLVREGIFVEGSNLIRDSARLSDGTTGMVDTSEWLFDMKLLFDLHWPTMRSPAHVANNLTEDDLLLKDLLSKDISIASSMRGTLGYTLGGYSNKKV